MLCNYKKRKAAILETMRNNDKMCIYEIFQVPLCYQNILYSKTVCLI